MCVGLTDHPFTGVPVAHRTVIHLTPHAPLESPRSQSCATWGGKLTCCESKSGDTANLHHPCSLSLVSRLSVPFCPVTFHWVLCFLFPSAVRDDVRFARVAETRSLGSNPSFFPFTSSSLPNVCFQSWGGVSADKGGKKKLRDRGTRRIVNIQPMFVYACFNWTQCKKVFIIICISILCGFVNNQTNGIK